MATPQAVVTVIAGVPTLVYTGLGRTPCRLATTANHGLSGLAAVDGVTPSADDRILVKSNTTGSENGIYTAASGAWTRAVDFDDSSADSIFAGVEIYISEGSANAQTKYTLTTTGTITIGTTSLVFASISGGTSSSTLTRGKALALHLGYDLP